MIIGLGFGSPLTAVLMLLVTGFISYWIFKAIRGVPSRSIDYPQNYEDMEQDYKEKRRKYYYEQRQRAYDLMEQYDLTDEEIERKVEQESK